MEDPFEPEQRHSVISPLSSDRLAWHRDSLIAEFATLLGAGMSSQLSEVIGASAFADAKNTLQDMQQALTLSKNHAQLALDRIRLFQFVQATLRLQQGQSHVRRLLQACISAVVGWREPQVSRYAIEVSPDLVLPCIPGPFLQLLCCLLQQVHGPDDRHQFTIAWQQAEQGGTLSFQAQDIDALQPLRPDSIPLISTLAETLGLTVDLNWENQYLRIQFPGTIT